MTDNVAYEMAVIILETPDQAECARLLATHFPGSSKQEMVPVINQCERDLPQMGFHENLSRLREELAEVHPAWNGK